MDERIKQYYLLCSIKSTPKQHILGQIAPDKLRGLFTDKELGQFLRNVDGNLIAWETIVGGDDSAAIYDITKDF